MEDNTQVTSAPGATLIPDSTSVITTAHFAILVIFAVLVILGIIWGVRLRARRRAAEREVAHDNAVIAHTSDTSPAAAPSVTTTPAPAPSPPPPPAPAIAPATPVDEPMPAAPPMADEPIAATAPLEASPASEAAAPVPPAADPIPVTTLKGLGPKVAARLAELGITDARDLAALDEAQAARLDADLGSFSGRMTRDRWIEQARFLAAGDRAGYEQTFGKL